MAIRKSNKSRRANGKSVRIDPSEYTLVPSAWEARWQVIYQTPEGINAGMERLSRLMARLTRKEPGVARD